MGAEAVSLRRRRWAAISVGRSVGRYLWSIRRTLLVVLGSLTLIRVIHPGKAPPTVPSESEVISDCVKEAYASLDKEVPALRAMHASDAAGFANVFAARKRAVVGVDALRAKGCAIAKVK